MRMNTQVVKNHPGGIRAVECVEMDTGDTASHKIVALLQRVLNPNGSDRVGIALARLESA